MVLEKTPESPLDSKEIKLINLKGDQLWIVTGGTDAEAEAPVFWSADINSRLFGKVPDAGKDWGQKEKKVSEDEMAGWHHGWNGHELGQTLGDGEEQGGLVCCSTWGCKESDMNGQLNSSNNQSHQVSCFSLPLLQLLQADSLKSGPTWSHPCFPLCSFPTTLLAFESLAKQAMVNDSLAIASSEYIAFAWSHLSGLHLFPLEGRWYFWPIPCANRVSGDERKPEKQVGPASTCRIQGLEGGVAGNHVGSTFEPEQRA